MTTPIAPPAAAGTTAAADAAPVDAAAAKKKEQLREAARQFDAVFVRIVLRSLEKTTKLGGDSSVSAGQSAYGSMVVDTVSDVIARAGGTGLADRLMDALGPRLAAEEAGTRPAAPGAPAEPPGGGGKKP